MFVNLLPRKCLTSVNSDDENTFLFTSDGGSLLVYNFTTSDEKYHFRHKIVIFDYSNIHDVIFSSDHRTCSISGEKSFVICDVNFRDDRFTVVEKSREIFCRDWLVASKFFGDFKLATLSSHNKVNIFDLKTNKFENSCQCEENCLLYSGLIDGDSLHNLKFVSGTIYNEILIWASDGEILHRLSGHKGVIFDLTLHDQILYSVSDDRTCKIWFWPRAEIRGTLYGHEARIWSVKRVDENRVLTCGEDSRIILWDSRECKMLKNWNPNRGSIRRIEFLERFNSFVCGTDYGSLFTVNLNYRFKLDPVEVTLPEDCEAAAVFFKNETFDIICITKDGAILEIENSSNCKVVYKSENLKYCCSAKCPDWITVGDLRGFVHFIHKHDAGLNKILKLTDSKIFSLNYVESLNNLLITVTRGLTLIYDLDDWCKVCEFSLPQQTLINCSIFVHNFLIIGDRDGNICFYEHENYTSPRQFFPQVHGKNGVTDLRVQRKENVTVASIGRDGCLIIWRFAKSWLQVSRVRICPGFEWPSKFSIYNDKNVLAGFKGNQFTLYDSEARNFLFTVECGGGHRSYDLAEAYCSLQFLYCRNGRVYRSIFDHVTAENEVLPNLHNRHVKQILNIENRFLVTCSEDTTLAIWDMEGDKFHFLRRLKSKFSSILCMDYDYDSRILCTGGGRGEICIFACDTVPDFRLVQFWRQNPDGGSDFRYLSVKFDGLSIFACRSDGILDMFGGPKLQHLASCQTPTCLTRLKMAANRILSTGTDGRLRFWNIGCQKIDFDRQVQIEKCGLTCLDAKISSGDNLICVIGAESGGISLCVYNDDNAIKCRVRTFYKHSSTVTDVLLVENTVFTLGVDQRIVEWDLIIDKNEIGLEAKKSYFTNVADCSSFLYMEDERKRRSIIVTGVGLQKLKL